MNKKPYDIQKVIEHMDDTEVDLEKEKSLPDEQQPDGDLEESQIQALEDAKDLSDYFDNVKTATVGEGIIKGTVISLDFTRKNNYIAVEVELPAEKEPEKFKFKKPKSWDYSYEFVRWLWKYGYSAEDFSAMVENNVRVEVKKSNGYELVIPSKDKIEKEEDLKTVNRKEKIKNWSIHKIKGLKVDWEQRLVWPIFITTGFITSSIAMSIILDLLLTGEVLIASMLITAIVGIVGTTFGIGSVIMYDKMTDADLEF